MRSVSVARSVRRNGLLCSFLNPNDFALAGEAVAYQHLGIVHDSLKDLPTSISFHEKQRQLLQEVDRSVALPDDHPAGVTSAYSLLVKRYKDLALSQANAGKLDEAISNWEKCAEAAQGCVDRASEGMSYHQLGLLNNQSQRPDVALTKLKQYLAIVTELDDKKGIAQAHCELGKAKRAKNDVQGAIESFEQYLNIAKEAKDEASENEASALLGRIKSETANHDESLKAFQRSFDIAKGGSDPEAIDRARIMLGVADANSKQSAYLRAVTGGLDALLEWKNTRKGL